MVRFFFFDFFYFLDYSETYRRMFHLYLNTLINLLKFFIFINSVNPCPCRYYRVKYTFFTPFTILFYSLIWPDVLEKAVNMSKFPFLKGC